MSISEGTDPYESVAALAWIVTDPAECCRGSTLASTESFPLKVIEGDVAESSKAAAALTEGA